jgi:RHS repeat-associated protein
LTSKTASGQTTVYGYNLQNRMASVTVGTDPAIGYKYNPDGIRIQKIEDPDGTATVTNYVIDPYNLTGYAQVLVEDDGSDQTSYIIGDDILAQATNVAAPKYLLYDGQGSTRQLADNTGSVLTGQNFSYDGYGVMLGGNPADTSGSTSLLYAGEHFDTDTQQYYNRARWYNPLNGRFNRVDPYSGNMQDPQSLHKYAYVHNNPINGIDPNGLFAVATQLVQMKVQSQVRSINMSTSAAAYGSATSTIIKIGFMAAVGTGILLGGATIAILLLTLSVAQATIDQKFKELEPLMAPSALAHIKSHQLETKVVAIVESLRDYAQKSRPDLDASRLPIYFVFESLTKDIYDHTINCLFHKNPFWSILHYYGPNRAENRRKRNEAISPSNSNWRDRISGDRTSPDEFPFASTDQGGKGASVEPVPWSEQQKQRIQISAFYHSQLNYQPGNFLVVPVPDVFN